MTAAGVGWVAAEFHEADFVGVSVTAVGGAPVRVGPPAELVPSPRSRRLLRVGTDRGAVRFQDYRFPLSPGPYRR